MPDRKSDMWAISGQSDGKRYGGCSFVDPTNTIYMIGGASGGPLAKPDSMLGEPRRTPGWSLKGLFKKVIRLYGDL